MGMDPIFPDETYEVTIILEGPVNRTEFESFRVELQTFIDKCTSRPAGPGGVPPAVAGIPWNHQGRRPGKNVLQVRVGRAGQRKNV